MASNAGSYEVETQHAVSRNDQKRASPSVDLILSESEPRMDKKHAAGRDRETLSLAPSLSFSISLCFKELDLLIKVILMILLHEGNNNPAMALGATSFSRAE